MQTTQEIAKQRSKQASLYIIKDERKNKYMNKGSFRAHNKKSHLSEAEKPSQ